MAAPTSPIGPGRFDYAVAVGDTDGSIGHYRYLDADPGLDENVSHAAQRLAGRRPLGGRKR